MIIFERQLKNELHIDFRNKVTEDSQLILKEEDGEIKLEVAGNDATMPAYSAEEAGKALKVNADGTGVEWADAGSGEATVDGIRLNIDDAFKMTADLLAGEEVVASSNEIDLPLESVVVNGEYDAENKAIVLTLQNGSTVNVPVGDLVDGLVSADDLAAHTENADIHVDAAAKAAWDAKADAADVEAAQATADEAKATADAHDQAIQDLQNDIAFKLPVYEVTVNGNAGQYVGEANVPAYFDIDAAADKITVNSYAFTLNATAQQTAVKSTLDVPCASSEAAGLMSAADKAIVDEVEGNFQTVETAINDLETAVAGKADASALDAKVEKEISGANGKAIIFNEADGGGAKFEGPNGTASFAGVNEDTDGGIGAQLYDINVAENKGSKLDVTKNGIYYTSGDASAQAASARDVEANEIAVKGDLLPACPADVDGTFVLKATVADGVVTYAWVAE